MTRGEGRLLTAKRAMTAFEVMAVAGVAILVALLVLRVVTPVGPIGVPNESRQASQATGSDIPDFDLFWPANRRAQTGANGPWHLHGVLYRQDHPTAILSEGKGKAQMVLKVGETVSAGTRLAEIGADFVVLESSSGRRTLYLDDAPAATIRAQRGVVLPGPLDPRLLEPYGLRAGDVILAVNGKPIAGAGDLSDLVSAQGQAVRVTVLRGQQTLEKVLKP